MAKRRKTDAVDAVQAERQGTYGPTKTNHDNIGMIWTGILQQHFGIQLPHPVPGHVVALMHTSMKCCRAATPLKFNPDNYLDGQAYLRIAENIDPRNEKGQKQ